MKKFSKKSSGGYTIIETMIAISLFVIIVMAGMGALLNANLLHQKSKDMRSIIDNLSFVMEDMSRNLRTGTGYHCFSSGETPTYDGTPKSCPNGGGVSFLSHPGDGQWVYYIGSNLNDPTKFSVFKIVNGGTAVELTPDEVNIDLSNSSFSVSGAEKGDGKQPFVTMKLTGKITYKGVDSPFSLETAVSQRAIDF